MSWFGLSVTARFEPEILMSVRYDDIETLQQLLYDSSDHEIAHSLRILQRSKFMVDKYGCDSDCETPCSNFDCVICNDVMFDSIEILATHLNKRRMKRILDIRAKRLIWKYVFNWLTKPVTDDGLLGIDARLGLKHLRDLAIAPLSM